MSQLDRIYRLRTLLDNSRGISRQTLLDTLEVSPATLKRDLEFLRSRLHTPVLWDRELAGYRLGQKPQAGARHELPGLWFSEREIHALLTMQHLLANLDPGGILAPRVGPLMERLDKLLGSTTGSAETIRRRVIIIGLGQRRLKLDHFQNIGSALLQRKRLVIRYYARGKGEESQREISPQRLVHYRENWYLDAWCHLRGALRNFALDSIHAAELLPQAATDIPAPELDAQFNPGYGIFAGKAVAHARLRFTAERARWVASEQWHPDQRAHFDAAGRYVLEVPYADHRELLMDILKHGRHCEVLGPETLREAVVGELKRTITSYEEFSGSGSPHEPDMLEDVGQQTHQPQPSAKPC